MTPFTLAIPQRTLDDIIQRVRAYPWHLMPSGGGWELGTDTAYLRELCAYWSDGFDWRAEEARLNRFMQFCAPVDGINLHFIHEKGSGENPMPLCLSHGRPGSVVEFLDIIERLAHPERFGSDIADAFDVVAPSLPGFGFFRPAAASLGAKANGGDV